MPAELLIVDDPVTGIDPGELRQRDVQVGRQLARADIRGLHGTGER